jgi:hypothetical protein
LVRNSHGDGGTIRQQHLLACGHKTRRRDWADVCLHRQTILKLAQTGKFPAVKLANQWRFTKANLLAVVNATQTEEHKQWQENK